MNFKELVESAADILGAEFSHDEQNIYAIEIEFEDELKEIVYVYQDIFESEGDGIAKKIIVCESLIGKYDESVNLLPLIKSNVDYFFSRACINDEDEKIIVESCAFMENLNSLNLSVIIDEVAQQSSFLHDEVLKKK
jgi:hypothetical protein